MTYPTKFLRWLEDNHHVYNAFEAEALAVAQRGHRRYSARTILHFLRHHSTTREAGGTWKLNDHHSPYLGRLFAENHPEYSRFFETRRTQMETLH